MLYSFGDLLVFRHEGRQLIDPVLELLAIEVEPGLRYECRGQRPPLTPNRPPIQILPLLPADESPPAVDLLENTDHGLLKIKERFELRLTSPDQLPESIKTLGTIGKIR